MRHQLNIFSIETTKNEFATCIHSRPFAFSEPSLVHPAFQMTSRGPGFTRDERSCPGSSVGQGPRFRLRSSFLGQRIANASPSGSGRPPRGPRPRDVICQTQTPAAPGAPVTAENLWQDSVPNQGPTAINEDAIGDTPRLAKARVVARLAYPCHPVGPADCCS